MTQLAYSEQVARSFAEHFDRHGLEYGFDGESGTFTIDFEVDSELANVRLSIQCWPDGFSSYAYCPLAAEQRNIGEAVEYLSRINYRLRYGSFDIDHESGTILFRIAARTGDVKLDEDLVIDAYDFALELYEHYGNGLVAVLAGKKTPSAAIQEAEQMERDQMDYGEQLSVKEY